MERVRELLENISTLTLSTVNPEGVPHAAPVYFVSDEKFHLYFFSDPDSHHSQDIEKKSQVAVAIYPECEDWRDIRGLQLHGSVNLVESPELWQSAWDLYQTKFPFVRSLKSVVAKNQLYIFVPNWIRLVDNSQGFGYKKEWNFP